MPSKPRKSADPGKLRPTRIEQPRKPALTKNIRLIEAPKGSSVPASTSKQKKCLDLLARRGGATLAELMTATEWQPHSVRGFLSGTVKKKLGLTLNSSRDANGTRRYSLERPTRGQ